MKKSDLIQIIKEEIQIVLKEDPDRSGSSIYSDADAVPFVVHNKKIYLALKKSRSKSGVGNPKNKMHGEIDQEYPKENNLDFNFDDTNGRLWTNDKKISFWYLETKYKPKIIDMINDELKSRGSDIKIDNTWKIELCDMWKFEDTEEYSECSVYLPVLDFTSGKIDYNQYKASWAPFTSLPNYIPNYLQQIKLKLQNWKLS